jgi:hypothetical protein
MIPFFRQLSVAARGGQKWHGQWKKFHSKVVVAYEGPW